MASTRPAALNIVDAPVAEKRIRAVIGSDTGWGHVGYTPGPNNAGPSARALSLIRDSTTGI